MASKAILDLVVNVKDNASRGIGGIVGGLGKLGLAGLGISAVTGAVGGLVEGFDNLTKAAGAERLENDQLLQSIKNNDAAFKGTAATLDALIAKGEAKAFGDSEIRESLAKLTAVTNDVTAATDLQGLAMDVARSRGISLEAATNAIAKAQQGSLGGLEKLGVEIDKNSTLQSALAELTRESAGAADIYAASSEGAATRSAASWQNAQEDIGAALLPLKEQILGGLANFLNSPEFQGAINMFTEWMAVIVPQAMQFLTDAWNNVLAPALQAYWSYLNDFIFPVLQTLWGWLEQTLPPVIKALAEFWTGTLQPALAEVWRFIDQNVIPILSEVLTWLADNIPPAIQTLADFWTGTLQPALNSVWSFISDNIIPIFETVLTWLADNIPPAIQSLADLWTNTLQPALKAIWDFIEVNLLPVFKSLQELGIAVVDKGLTALAGLWEKVIKPPLTALWEFIDTNLLPIFKSFADEGIGKTEDAFQFLSDAWNNVLSPALNELWNFLASSLQPAIDGISNALMVAKAWFDQLAVAVSELELPDWLTPGSPTPLEYGLRGIADALGGLNRNGLPGFEQGLEGVGGAREGIVQLQELFAKYVADDETQYSLHWWWRTGFNRMFEFLLSAWVPQTKELLKSSMITFGEVVDSGGQAMEGAWRGHLQTMLSDTTTYVNMMLGELSRLGGGGAGYTPGTPASAATGSTGTPGGGAGRGVGVMGALRARGAL
jgi:hypothetical protein